MPTSGSVLVSGNVVGLSFIRAVMLRVAPGVWNAELQAQGDGMTRTIGRYIVTVVPGVLQ